MAKIELTDAHLRNLKTPAKVSRITDATVRGLVFESRPNGRQSWLFRFEREGQEHRLGLGPYPEITLAEARSRAMELRRQLAHGVNPATERRKQKIAAKLAREREEHTFEAVAREWFEKSKPSWKPGKHVDQIMTRLEANIFPWLGELPIGEITPKDLLPVLQRMEERGTFELAQRVRRVCGQIFAYGVATGVCMTNPAQALSRALTAPRRKHHACLKTPREIGGFVRAIYGLQASFPVMCGMKVGMFTFLRPGELRTLLWSEVHLESDYPELRLDPAPLRKLRHPLIVPLALEVVNILEALRPLTGNSEYVFPSVRSLSRPMSENTINAVIRRMGYGPDQMTAHGLRGMASTVLNESGRWTPDAIERQLDHNPRDQVRASYNHATRLPERREMMAWYADRLLELGGQT